MNADRLYDLCAVVVHCGSTPNRGHYITVVKSHAFWLLFDDDIVDVSFCYFDYSFFFLCFFTRVRCRIFVTLPVLIFWFVFNFNSFVFQ